MKDIYKIIKESFILLAGAGLFTYGLFSFISTITRPMLFYRQDIVNNALIYLVVGVIFIIIGLVKTRKG